MRNGRDRRAGNKLCLHLTNRLICGLPFVQNIWFTAILESILARAQEMHPVQVSAFLWMGNHYHMILFGRVNNISGFKNYLHGEIGKVLKRLLPDMYQSRVWDTGRGREQALISAEDVFNKLAYLYLNPVRAGLEERVSKYPGLSSWKMLCESSLSFEAQWIRPSSIKILVKGLSTSQDIAIYKANREANCKKTYSTFKLSPYGWKRCFPESRELDDREIRSRILRMVASGEEEIRKERKGLAIVGARALRQARLDREHKPEKKTKTPFVICHDPELRKRAIESYKLFRAAALKSWREFKNGVKKVVFPQGAYLPGMPNLVRLNT